MRSGRVLGLLLVSGLVALSVVADARPRGTPAGGPSGCTIVGTNGNDVLRGTRDADVICGSNGDDAMVGLSGRDRIIGGRGNDRIDGGPGADLVLGGRGADLVAGGAGDDGVKGGPNHDAVYGDGDSDVVQAGRGQDFCLNTDDGVDGNDLGNGGAGRDVFDADQGDVVVNAETARSC